MIIDLLEPKPNGQGSLSKMAAKPDSQGDGTYIYTLDVSFRITSSKEAEVLEKLIPGAKESYLRASERDDWKNTQAVTPDMEGARIVLADAKDGQIAMQGGAEIKTCILRCSKKAAVLTLKLACGGQGAACGTPLIGLLGRAVDLQVEVAQQLLPFNRPAVQVSVGGIAVAKDANGETVFGRVVEIGDEIVLSTFGGQDEVVNQDDIVSCYALPSDDATEKALKDYQARCKKRKVNPTYRAITVALSEAYSGVAANGGTHPLTSEIVERAVVLTAKPAEEAQPDNVRSIAAVG